MKNHSAILRQAGISFLALLICIAVSGCVESSSGMPYSELPKPKGATFTQWQPLTDSEPETPPATDQQKTPDATTSEQAPATDASQTTTKQNSNPDASTAESPGGAVRLASGENSDSATAIAPAVDKVTESPATPDALSPDMTAEERMNALMNNPDLEESSEVLEMKLLIPEKRFRKEDGGKVIRVSYDDIDLLKVLNMQPVPADAADHFPNWLSNLDGQRIRIRGFMIPPFQARGLKRFALARDNGICCFVRTPKIYDVIDVRMAEGQTTHYIANTPFDVEGIFRIQPIADDGELYKLYKIENATVIE